MPYSDVGSERTWFHWTRRLRHTRSGDCAEDGGDVIALMKQPSAIEKRSGWIIMSWFQFNRNEIALMFPSVVHTWQKMFSLLTDKFVFLAELEQSSLIAQTVDSSPLLPHPHPQSRLFYSLWLTYASLDISLLVQLRAELRTNSEGWWFPHLLIDAIVLPRQLVYDWWSVCWLVG